MLIPSASGDIIIANMEMKKLKNEYLSIFIR